jgi:hypothetical protein
MVSKVSLRRRPSERGAAIFVVVMVLTMLTAIGVFAVRASSLANASAGYDRQNTQNHYVGELGVLGVVSELSSLRRDFYFNKVVRGTETCKATKLVATSGSRVPCYPVHQSDIQVAVLGNFAGRPLLEPTTMSGGTLVPGSLGPAGLEGDFIVELTDPGPVGQPIQGTDVGGTNGSTFHYYQMTLTSVGEARPSSGTACVESTAGVAGNETGRAFVVFGPIKDPQPKTIIP